ncbi:hypothetical protein LOTGIDRAFT_130366 [Lottia gigantea]|uniref:RING-type domain-containing protein n=1 Tax=Lottia gigantea TaxID=225164 RepID=V3ZXN5_LOTGI|nr:hypothetical protein LOTGIDRAFT_130366 [Lottia gigantea]ESO85746.1 hypothetical protein LOTGIDRAFT_130366 [Lottia gigantea]
MYCGEVSDTVVLTTRVNRIDAINNVNHDATKPTQPSVNRADSTPNYSQSHYKSQLTDSREAKLRSEDERLRTFNDGWPHSSPTPADLAKEGFFFTQSADRVQCIFCNGILKNWEVTDIPAVEHRKHFPGCGLIRNRDVGNIPRMVDVQSDLGITLPVLNDSRIEVLWLDERLPSTGIFTEPPRHPQYVTEASRIASFANWPKGVSQTPQMLAKAGFFYAGFDDSVKCFHCDGGLRTWEANDDPWKEHARWFSRCPYVLQVKGEAFVRRFKNGIFYFLLLFKTQKGIFMYKLNLKKGQKKTVFHRVASFAKVVTQCNLNLDIHLDILQPSFLYIHLIYLGDDFDSVEDLLNAIYHLGDNQVMPPTNTHPPAMPTLTDKNQRLKDQRTCKICMDEEANIVLLPCGHLVSCATCAPALRKCPICRAGIKGTVRTYIS